MRGKLGGKFENKGGCGDHSGDYEMVLLQSERFDPKEGAAGVSRLAQSRLFGRLKRSAEFVGQRCIKYGYYGHKNVDNAT
jgi:hypothetical protein